MFTFYVGEDSKEAIPASNGSYAVANVNNFGNIDIHRWQNTGTRGTMAPLKFNAPP